MDNIEQILTRMEQKLDYIYNEIKTAQDAKQASKTATTKQLDALSTYLADNNRDNSTLSADSKFHISLAEFYSRSDFLTDKQLGTFPLLSKPIKHDNYKFDIPTEFTEDEIPF